MTTQEWQPGKPWTHPSITRLSDEELRERYADAVVKIEDDTAEFGDDPREDARDLLRLDREAADTYLRALESRGLS